MNMDINECADLIINILPCHVSHNFKTNFIYGIKVYL